MTVLNHYEGMDGILTRLRAVRIRRRMFCLAAGAAAVVTVAAISLMTAAAAAGYWQDQPPAVLRWALLVGLCCAWSGALIGFLLPVLIRGYNPAQTARFVEQALPELQNNLISPLLLAGDSDPVSREMVQEVIRQSSGRAGRVDLNRSIPLVALRRWSIAAFTSVVLLTAFAVLQAGPFARGLLAVVNPRSFVPTFGTLELAEPIIPGDATVFASEEVTIIAHVRNASGRKLTGEVLLATGQRNTMLASEGYSVFSMPLGRVDQSFGYAVKIGDTRWPADKPSYHVRVVGRVEISGIKLLYKYPAYTALEPQTVSRSADDATVEAPVGTDVTVTLELSEAVEAVMLGRSGASAEQMKPSADGKSFSSTFRVERDGGYGLILRDGSGRTVQRFPQPDRPAGAGEIIAGSRGQLSGYYRIRAVPDPAPRVEFLSPNRDVSAAPGEKVRMRIKATDKYGLANVKIFAGPVDKPGEAVAVQSLAGQQREVFDFEYTVDKSLPDDKGIVIVYHATATDRRNLSGRYGPQTSESPKFRIVVEDASKVSALRAKRYEELHRRLKALLKMQAEQRVNASLCLQRHRRLLALKRAGDESDKADDIHKQVRKIAGWIPDAQRKIRAEMIDLLENFPFERRMANIQQVLAMLAGNEAHAAIDQSLVFLAALRRQAKGDSDLPARRDKAAGALMVTQDKIISALQILLAIMPSSANRSAKDTAPGDDLPPEVRRKLRNLSNELKNFIEAQSKAVEATRRLAKKPVDNFNADDEKILKELEALQDKWEKFLNESFTDFSKLARQDFSNPVIMKELLSVKTDVTMAKDALSKKATEIATAAEDNGVENAKTLTANLEKWLPDEPDRIKWAMEAPEDQKNFEMPELPAELEDLVGNLLEQEEDLFDEMQDVTSNATGSFDKGAGWDAMDGPISSMNAQGVTGNQLPNSSEVSGRSGEGRSGKSSGEFVEDKAVGKGGRRTPTRLTGEPFSKGRVDDKSTEPPGGATGGGKLSGSGAEGLEGPVPPQLAKQLKRLGGKQAALINRAERIRAKFKVSDYSNFKFIEAITLMDRVRSDLENNRYRNALRARKGVTDALRQTGLLLGGKVDVTEDTSAAMPKYIRDDISDARAGKIPAEFRGALEQYYRRISAPAHARPKER